MVHTRRVGTRTRPLTSGGQTGWGGQRSGSGKLRYEMFYLDKTRELYSFLFFQIQKLREDLVAAQTLVDDCMWLV